MEIFKDIPNYEGLYQVSNLGNVKSLHNSKAKKEKILKKGDNFTGYYNVILSKNSKRKLRTIHSLVAEAFLNHKPNGHKLVVNHKNNIKTDNRLENLEVITQRENTYTHHKGTSKYKGVSLDKDRNKWRATIYINGKNNHLGYYHNESNAHLAYQHALKNL